MTAPFAPTFLTPSSDGMLTNRRGASAGDSLNVTAKYKHPSSVPLGSMAFSVTRTYQLGQPSASPEVLAYGVFGKPTGSPLPVAASPHSAVVTYAGRIFTLSSAFALLSSPTNGQSQGSWRVEAVPGSAKTLAVVNGYLYTVLSSQPALAPPWGTTRSWQLAWAKIATDGTLGAWSFSPKVNTTGGLGGVLVGYSDGSTYAWLAALGASPGDGNMTSATRFFTLSLTDGSPTNAPTGTAGTALPTNLIGHAAVYDPVLDMITVAGGALTGAGAPVANVRTMAGPRGNSLLGAWTAGTALTVATIYGSLHLDYSGVYHYSGGYTAAGPATPTANTYNNTNPSSAAWTAGTALRVANAQMGIVMGPSNLGSYTIVVGGIPSQVVDIYDGMAWFNSPTTAFSGASMTGGGYPGSSVASQVDGSMDVTWAFQALTSAVADGDVLQFSITFIDNTTGDSSAVAIRSVKIGQAPVISAVVPANAGAPGVANPVASFAYAAGAGGGAEDTYRISVVQGGVTVFDTGIKRDGANSAVIDPPTAQRLANAVATMTITVASVDKPVPGAVSTASSVTTFTPAAGTQNVPTAVTAVADGANGVINVGWAAPAGGEPTGGYRVYFKLQGGPTWKLLKANIASGTHAFAGMEELKLRTAYDFAVSAIGANGQESALATALNVTINPPSVQAGGYTAMLHVVGNGPAQHLNINLFAQGAHGHAETLGRHVDVQTLLGFGNVAPTARVGVYNYRSLELKVILQGLANRDSLDALIAAVMTGAVLCYRDTVADLMYLTVSPTWKRQEGRFHLEDFRLIETAFAYTP